MPSQIYLPSQQAIALSGKQYLGELLRQKDLGHTMFTVWMHINEIDPKVRPLIYAKFSTKFVWNKCVKQWDGSKNDWVRKKA